MTPLTAVISRSPDDEAGRRRFEDDLALALAQRGLQALMAPHLYYLPDGHPVARRLAADGTDLVVAAWMHPRAAEWTLRWHLGRAGLHAAEAARSIRCIDPRAFATAAECAEAMTRLAQAPEIPQPARRAVEDLSSAAAPRWYPVIDCSLCSRCKQCLDFCLFGVYRLGESGAPRVENPDECKPGCPACARVCPRGAIMFPHYDAEPAIAGAEASGAEPPAPADHEDLDKLIEELESMEL